jgi:hypothetical protein
LLVVDDLGEELAARAGDGRGSGGGGIVLRCGGMREKHDGTKCEQDCRGKTRHVDLQDLVRGKREGVYNEIEVGAGKNSDLCKTQTIPEQAAGKPGKLFFRG